MIETLTNNIEFIITFIAVMSAPAFIMVVTALFKKAEMYTPFIATIIGAVFGLLGSYLAIVSIDGINTLPLIIVTVFAGLVQGIVAGASAVGIKVVADGEPEPIQENWE